jgi:fibro-slime domain-containing protein
MTHGVNMQVSRSRIARVVLAVATVGCSTSTGDHEVGVYVAPAEAAAGSPSIPAPTPVLFLTMLIRDFKVFDANDPTTNPDFDNFAIGNSEKSVVMSELGADGKPSYMPPNNAIPTLGKAAFDQWYHDAPGTNYPVGYPLPLTPTSDGQYEYDSQKSGTPDFYLNVHRRVFLPIDDGTTYSTPFGNQRASHNFAFTAEAHATFNLTDTGGRLQVRADDDLYVFVDGKLVIDLGGTHGPIPGDVDLGSLGLTVGQDYPLDIFYAERLGATGDLMLRTDLKLVPREP